MTLIHSRFRSGYNQRFDPWSPSKLQRRSASCDFKIGGQRALIPHTLTCPNLSNMPRPRTCPTHAHTRMCPTTCVVLGRGCASNALLTLRSYFALKGGTQGKGRDMERPQGRRHVRFDVYVQCGHGRAVNELPNHASVRSVVIHCRSLSR